MRHADFYGDIRSAFTVPSPLQPPAETESDEQAPAQEMQTDDAPESVTVKRNGNYIHCLTIIGQVEGHTVLPSTVKTTKYEHMIPRIVAVEESAEIDGLLLVLNTVGGDVEAGLAIAELIAGMKKPTVSLVLGGGHSIGIPLAVSARYSLIAPSATMTIHPVRMTGLVLGVPQTMTYFYNIQERIVAFVESHSGMRGDRFRELMLKGGNLMPDLGTVLCGGEAVAEGLIDATGSIADALAQLERMIEKEK